MLEERDYFTEDELKKILSYDEWKTNEHRLWLQLMYCFGLNVQELTNLKVKDIDFDAMVLKVYSSRRSKPRILNIPKAIQLDLRKEALGKYSDDHLFQGRKGPVHKRTVQKVMERVFLKFGIYATVSKFRKTFALHSIKYGWDEKSIAMALGHSSIRATRLLMGKDRIYFERKKSHPIDHILRIKL